MQSIARLKPALTVVLVWAPLLAVCSNQATTVDPSVTVGELPQDLSPWGTFLDAEQFVKALMIGLAVASLVTWTIWFAKSIELIGARATVQRALRMLVETNTLAQASEKLRGVKGPVAQLTQAAANEISAFC